MKSITFIILLSSLFGASCGVKTDSSADRIVETNKGKIAGYVDETAEIVKFLGIPFAKPPIGELRWKAPVAMQPWQEIKDAKTFGNQCMQNYIYDDMRFRSDDVSEDCLYLNVWTPANFDQTKSYPVLLYFYGGGFIAGDSSEGRYDGTSMAQKNIVVVTTNYRMGIFGLFAHPELSAESNYQGSGNYTFLDQHAALQWVTDNIQTFGGDPKRITIGGESAGSMSVSALMASPLSKDMIAGAIGQSGSIVGPPLAAIDLDEAHQHGENSAIQILKQLNIEDSSLHGLRSISSRDLLKAVTDLKLSQFNATVDGLFFPQAPQKLYSSGHFAKVPLLAGVNSQEGAYGWILGKNEVSVENYRSAIKDLYPADYETVLTLYPASNELQVMDSAQALASDRFISFATWNWIDQVSQQSLSPTYYYVYNHIRPARKKSEGGSGTHNNRGAVHSAEIEYVFGNLDVNPLYEWTSIDYKVSDTIQTYFAQFIKYQDPNAEDLPKWPTFATNQMLIIDESPSAEVTDSLRQRYAFHKKYFSEN